MNGLRPPLQKRKQLADVNDWVWFSLTLHPSTSKKCWMGLKSGEYAGQFIVVHLLLLQEIVDDIHSVSLSVVALEFFSLADGTADRTNCWIMASQELWHVRLPFNRRRGILWWLRAIVIMLLDNDRMRPSSDRTQSWRQPLLKDLVNRDSYLNMTEANCRLVYPMWYPDHTNDTMCGG